MMSADPKSAITPARGAALSKPDVHQQALAELLEQYSRERYNIATPITILDQVPPMHRVSIRVVEINPLTETYPIPGGRKDEEPKVGLGKTALDKIAAAAGITWIPERSGQIDAWNERHRVAYRATAQIRDFDGRTRVVFAEKEVDLRGEPGWPEEQLGSDAREFARQAARYNRDPWPQILQQRQHIHSMAESKAKLRCIRSAIGLPVSMLKSQAAKPFVVPCLVPDLDTSDPEIRRMMAASLIGSQQALYGPALPTGAQAPAMDEPEPIDVSDFEEVTPADVDPAIAGQQTLPIDAEPEPWEAEAETVHPCPLPITDADLGQLPRDDDKLYERRCEQARRINLLYDKLVQIAGQAKAAGVVSHAVGATWTITGASNPEINALGVALHQAVTEAGGGA